MTNEEAINWIRLDIDMTKFDPSTGEEAYLNDEAKKVIEAMEMAIDALERVSLPNEENSNSFPKDLSHDGEFEMNCSDVPDTNVGKTDFQPGDKFILELGAERRMFGEFEIKGTDLYVKTDLLEKLTRYEPEMKTEKIPYKKPEIIRCKDCQYRDPEDKKCDHGHGIVWQLPRPDDWFCADGKA